MVGRHDHWNEVYSTAPSEELSWFEREPATSLRLIEECDLGAAASVIDVGGGTSLLVDRLQEMGFVDLTVLDISRRALDELRQRLGERAQGMTFFEQDVLTWRPSRRYNLWHDRAVFHFLTEPRDRERYVETARAAVGTGNHLVLATFAEDGPEQCSGLPVARYSVEDLAAVFSPHFEVVMSEREEHCTPRGVLQPFTWVVLRRD